MASPLERSEDLDPLLDKIGNARYVLLGEASHGTADYYTWRAQLSQRLIEEKGFRAIAVEGDWPDCYRVNRFIRHLPNADQSAREALYAFKRWPTWMWGNTEVEALTTWLRDYNTDQPESRQVGFYGLDVYSLWESLFAIIAYLKQAQPDSLKAALAAFRCFQPYGESGQDYARATMLVPTNCQEEVLRLLVRLRRDIATGATGEGPEDAFNAEQNAVVVRDAEAYYRTMVRGDRQSWNVRDHHMMQTLDRIMAHLGSEAKAIVWEHNTHVGDARFTDMADGGMVNVGELTREAHGVDGVVLVGCSSYSGTVIAGREWDAPMEVMTVPPARPDSWEEVLHRSSQTNKLLLLDQARGTPDFLTERGHRAIGVVYNPEYERFGNYVPSVLPKRYDALLYIDRTEALHPLAIKPDLRETPETFPSAM